MIYNCWLPVGEIKFIYKVWTWCKREWLLSISFCCLSVFRA